MNHIFNITKIRDLMDDPPKAQRLHHFMNDDNQNENILDEDQKLNLIKIIEDYSKEAIIEISKTLKS